MCQKWLPSIHFLFFFCVPPLSIGGIAYYVTVFNSSVTWAATFHLRDYSPSKSKTVCIHFCRQNGVFPKPTILLDKSLIKIVAVCKHCIRGKSIQKRVETTKGCRVLFICLENQSLVTGKVREL